MSYYRLVFPSSESSRRGRRIYLHVRSDENAVKMAGDFACSVQAELWKEDRFVTRLDGTSAANPEFGFEKATRKWGPGRFVYPADSQ